MLVVKKLLDGCVMRDFGKYKSQIKYLCCGTQLYSSDNLSHRSSRHGGSFPESSFSSRIDLNSKNPYDSLKKGPQALKKQKSIAALLVNSSSVHIRPYLKLMRIDRPIGMHFYCPIINQKNLK